jgi:predicted DNA-binding transcriptional regulator YafY
MLNQHKILRVLQLIALLKKSPAKSIKNLASILSNTDRTIYRYLDLIKELGFDLQRDAYNKYFIFGSDTNTEMGFTNEEAQFLTSLLKTAGKNHILKDSILKKIFLKSEIALNAEDLLNAHLSKIVEDITKAIAGKNQILLKKYHSANSNLISDRLVEPIRFTDNFSSICAYEVATGKNKYFNIERISDVQLQSTNFKFENAHKFELPDPFGFSDHDGPKTPIDLRLNLRAYTLLKEEFPLVAPYIKPEPKTNTYRLVVSVNNITPVKRFILGLQKDVEVLSGEGLFVLRN